MMGYEETTVKQITQKAARNHSQSDLSSDSLTSVRRAENKSATSRAWGSRPRRVPSKGLEDCLEHQPRKLESDVAPFKR